MSRWFVPGLATLLVFHASSAWSLDKIHSPVSAAREAKFRQLMSGNAPARLQQQVLRDARSVVQSVVRNPGRSLSTADKAKLGLASPQLRATLLKEEASFTVQKRKWKISGTDTRATKLVLKIPDNQTKLTIFNKVMSPNNAIFMPAGGHAKYVFNGKVADLWGMYNGTSALRSNRYPLYSTWLSDGEAKRMHSLFAESKKGGYSGFQQVLGPQKLAYGRPGMWPVTSRTRNTQNTGNSCTTGFIRAPVGERKASYRWIDTLQQSVAQVAGRVRGAGLGNKTLLEAVSSKGTAERNRIFDAVKRALPQNSRAAVDRLKGEVDLVAAVTPRFPMEMLHRKPLAEIANIAGDPVGPGGASRKFKAADPIRVGVMMQFER